MALDVPQARPRTDAPVFVCTPSLIPFSVSSTPPPSRPSGKATLWTRQGLPGVEEGPWTWTPGPDLHLIFAPNLHHLLLHVTACPWVLAPPLTREKQNQAPTSSSWYMRSDGARITHMPRKQQALARSNDGTEDLKSATYSKCASPVRH